MEDARYPAVVRLASSVTLGTVIMVASLSQLVELALLCGTLYLGVVGLLLLDPAVETV